jgi:phosphoribosylglycinamide formyltransferase-1
MQSKINIAVFASGSGTNAEAIYNHFTKHPEVNFKVLFCNKQNAGVISRAQNWDVETILFTKDEFYSPNSLLDKLENLEIDFIVLAGFLWLIPAVLIKHYENKIINIHPALLPNYGGKGMYGMNVHQSVIKNQEKESGITIHLVNEEYDKGEILLQAKVNIENNDTPEILASKIHQLEHKYFPKTLEEYFLRKEKQ